MATPEAGPVDPAVLMMLVGVTALTAGLCILRFTRELLLQLVACACLAIATAVAMVGAVLTFIDGSWWCVPLLPAAVALLVTVWGVLNTDV